MTEADDIVQLRREVADLRDALARKADVGPFLGKRCEVAENVRIDPGCVLRTGDYSPIRIGEHSQVWQGAQWLGPITVGKGVFINQGSYIRPHVTIGDHVSLGPFVRLISDTHDIGTSRRTGKPRKDPITIGEGTWIGAGATVMGGVTIGKRSIVAVGAVVNRDVPDNVVVAGVPARIVRSIEDGENGPALTTYVSALSSEEISAAESPVRTDA